jgi:hypothetical protein
VASEINVSLLLNGQYGEQMNGVATAFKQVKLTIRGLSWEKDMMRMAEFLLMEENSIIIDHGR